MDKPKRLSLFVQTIYSQLLEELVDASRENPVGQRPGTFVTKKVKDSTYVYLQTSRGGAQKQTYIGPESDELTALIYKIKKSISLRKQLTKMAVGGGAQTILTPHRKVLELLDDSGIFQLGAVLIGAQAFSTYGNMFGVRWDRNIVATHDIDIAGEATIKLAAESTSAVDLPSQLEAWTEMTLLPVPPSPLNPSGSITSYKDRDSELKIEFLTPMRGRERQKSVELPQFKATAQPLRFLDYLIEDPIQAAVVGGDGVLINVPRPERFALHKLIVATRRKRREKRQKDLAHAESLCWVLLDESVDELNDAWEALVARGPTWASSARNRCPS